MALKAVSSKIEKGWSLAKKTLAAASVWGLIFSIVTIAKLGVAFEYDDVLVNSAAAYRRGYSQSQVPYTPGFWSAVNNAYDLERPKLTVYPLAWLFRVFGFRVSVVSSRPPVDAEPLKKEWRYLISRGNFHLAGDEAAKAPFLSRGHVLLYFASSDSAVLQARRAKVYPIRVRRHKDSVFKDDYNPGTLGELVLPFSEF